MYAAFVYLFFSACEDVAPEKKKPTKICDLSLDDLNGTKWVYAKTVGSGEPEPNVKIRLKFEKKDGKLTARYNASSPTNMYDYKCASKSDKIHCSTKPEAIDVCLAFLAADKKCTRKAMEGFYSKTANLQLSQKEIREAAIAANKKMIGWKKENVWESQYKRRYSSVGNRLMGVLYVKVDREACNLEITDNFAALSNGEYQEDAAGFVSTNAFLKHTQTELLWEGCSQPALRLYDTNLGTFPADPGTITWKQKHFVGEEVSYWLLESSLRYPQEGCKYKFDAWLNMQPLKMGNEPKVVEGKEKELHWGFKHTFNKATAVGDSNIMAWVIETKCGDKVDKKIACNQLVVGTPKGEKKKDKAPKAK